MNMNNKTDYLRAATLTQSTIQLHTEGGGSSEETVCHCNKRLYHYAFAQGSSVKVVQATLCLDIYQFLRASFHDHNVLLRLVLFGLKKDYRCLCTLGEMELGMSLDFWGDRIISVNIFLGGGVQ